jgi:hypothetical protein
MYYCKNPFTLLLDGTGNYAENDWITIKRYKDNVMLKEETFSIGGLKQFGWTNTGDPGKYEFILFDGNKIVKNIWVTKLEDEWSFTCPLNNVNIVASDEYDISITIEDLLGSDNSIANVIVRTGNSMFTASYSSNTITIQGNKLSYGVNYLQITDSTGTITNGIVNKVKTTNIINYSII